MRRAWCAAAFFASVMALSTETASSAEVVGKNGSIRVAPTVHVQLRAGESTTLFLRVPESLRARDSIAFHLNRAVSDAIGGSGAGVFMSGDATVPVAVRVPARLTSGVHRLGDLRFWSADGTGDRIIIPIELRILADTMAILRAGHIAVIRAPGSDTRIAPDGTSAPPDRVAGAVTVTATPRSVELVRVARPDQWMAADAASFTVTRTSAVAVGGPASGVLNSDNPHVLLSVSVPANARAGRMRVAEVAFANERSEETVLVPVDVQVAPVYNVSVVSASPLALAVQGKQTTVRLVLSNDGNVEDTVRLVASIPNSWRGRVREDRWIVLAPGGSVSRDVELSSPQGQTGTTNITFRAERAPGAALPVDESVSTLVLPVDVVSPQTASPFGPVLGVSYNAVHQQGSEVQDSWAFSLAGPIAHGISMNASWTQRALVGAPGLARVGGGELFPSLTLSHERWRMDAGNATTDFGDLAGMVRSGRGLSALYGNAQWQARALLSTPFAFDVDVLPSGRTALRTRYTGVLAGASLQAERDGTAWIATASRLRDPLLMRAQLDAFSIGAERVDNRTSTARAALAWRRWSDGAGIGALAELGQRREDRDWRLRAAHAPGGSRAFARAQTDVTITGAQRLGATRIGFMGFYAADGDEAQPSLSADGNRLGALRPASRQETRGVAVMPQWRVGSTGSLGLEARYGEASSGDQSARLSTLTQVLGLFSSMRIAAISASTSASYVQTERTIDFANIPSSTLSDVQLNWSGQLLWPTLYGVFDMYSSVQRRVGADALSDGQVDVVLRAERMAVPLLGNTVHLNAAVGRSRSLMSGRSVTTQRFGLSSMLPLATYLRLDVERNPFLGLAGVSGWSTALRVERSFGTPSFMRAGRGTGVVFEDRNGNGVRDNGEPGLAGVLLRVGGEVVVTDGGGGIGSRGPVVVFRRLMSAHCHSG